TEVLAVGKDLRLERKECAAGVDEVDAREAVLLGHLLRAQVLLHGQREVRAALDGGVVRDHDAFPSFDDADSRDDPGRRRAVVVQPPGGEGAELEECSARVDEQVDPLARGQLPTRAVSFSRRLAAAERDLPGARTQLCHERLHPRASALELRICAIDVRAEQGHRVSVAPPADRRRAVGTWPGPGPGHVRISPARARNRYASSAWRKQSTVWSFTSPAACMNA